MPIRGRGVPGDPLLSTPVEVLDVEAMSDAATGAPCVVLYLLQPETDETWAGWFGLDEWRRLMDLGGRAMAAIEDDDAGG